MIQPAAMLRLALCCAIATGAFSPATSTAAVQRTFYVAVDGSDENSGTKAKPFATIQRARDAVREINRNLTGDVVVVLGGGTHTLDESLVFDYRDSGTGGHKVVYRSAPGEQPVISGGKAITGWQPDADGRWKARTTIRNFRQLYVNGWRAVRARGGPLPGAKFFGKDGYTTTNARMADWANQSDIELCYQSVWIHNRCKVTRIERRDDGAILTMLQPQFRMARLQQGIQVEVPSYVENALELLDEPDEWYLDRTAGVVYYMPRHDEDMRKVRVIAPVVEKLVVLGGTLDQPVRNIRFEGITFADASWLTPSKIGLVGVQANFVIDPAPKRLHRHAGNGTLMQIHNENVKSPANIVCHAAKSIRFERCIFTRLGGAGIDLEFGSQDNVISGCHFHDISGTAIQVGDVLKDDHHPGDERMIVKNNTVVNNYIHDVCVEYEGGVGVFVGYTDGTIVAHNEICSLPYSGVSVGWGWGHEDAGGCPPHGYHPFDYDTPTPARNNRIEQNHIHHVMQELDDGGAIYTLSNQPDTIIRGNHLHDNKGGPAAIYLDRASGFIEATGNLVYNVRKAMNYNNRQQNRIATCPVHGNWFGAPPGGTPRCPGKVGKALLCNGTSSSESVPHSKELEPKHMTVEAWVHLSEYPSGHDRRRWIVNKNTHEASESHYALAIDGKKAAAFLNIGGYHEVRSDEILALNRWHHLAMTYDGSILKVHVDGREVASTKIDKQRVPGSTPLDIGRRQDGSFYFGGRIDEVRLYNRALSAKEVKKNATATGSADSKDAVVADGLVRHWDFEDTPATPPKIKKIVAKAGVEREYQDLFNEPEARKGR